MGEGGVQVETVVYRGVGNHEGGGQQRQPEGCKEVLALLLGVSRSVFRVLLSRTFAVGGRRWWITGSDLFMTNSLQPPLLRWQDALTGHQENHQNTTGAARASLRGKSAR